MEITPYNPRKRNRWGWLQEAARVGADIETENDIDLAEEAWKGAKWAAGKIQGAWKKYRSRKSKYTAFSRMRDIRFSRKSTTTLQQYQTMKGVMGALEADMNGQGGPILDPNNNTLTTTTNALKTIRTYYADEPWQYNISDHIRRSVVDAGLLSDKQQKAVDITGIYVKCQIINYAVDQEVKLKALLVRRSYDWPSARSTPSATSLTLEDFWNDRVDKGIKYDFNKVFPSPLYPANWKSYGGINTRTYKIWKQRNVIIKSNPHSTDVGNTGSTDLYSPVSGEKDLMPGRVIGRARQNERFFTFVWRPKNGVYRMKFRDYDNETEQVIDNWPEHDLRFIMLPFEISNEPRCIATQNHLGYRFEITVSYKDLV